MSGTKKNTPHFRVGNEKPHAEACGEHLAPKTFYIRTYGCQMNDRDSELVAGLLLKRGYHLAESEKDADIILLNTGSVRQRAEDKVWSEIGALKRLKTKDQRLTSKGNKNSQATELCWPIIGLIGCMAENYQQSAFTKSPFIDLVVGPNNINSIPDLIEKMESKFSRGLAVGKDQRDAVVYNTEYIEDKSHCNVIIAEGCDNFCSYCIVPYVRGRERSRAVKDIVTEIKGLVAKGVPEITLLGQNVNSYQAEGISFMDLLTAVNEIKGLKQFDFVTSHPKDASLEMFKAMARLDKCKKFLHLPVQSGSNRILELMNRGYTREHYLDLVNKAREIVPGLDLTTDVMVGFPGETDADFEDTLNLFKEIKFDAAYIFKYSPRPNTKAAQLKDKVALEVIKKRHQVLLSLQKNLHGKKGKW